MSAARPDAAAFEALAARALAELPAGFRDHLDGVVVRVAEFAPAEILAELGCGDRWDLTGLYQGRPLAEQSLWASGELPPVIWLYRQPLLREMDETGVSLEALVRHVVVHEVGHHFGLSDEDMDAIENDPDAA